MNNHKMLQQNSSYSETNNIARDAISGPTRHRPSSDTGADIIGWHFTEKSLGKCVVLAPDAFLDENNILWHTLQVSCSR